MLPMAAGRLPDFKPIFERYAGDLKGKRRRVDPGVASVHVRSVVSGRLAVWLPGPHTPSSNSMSRIV